VSHFTHTHTQYLNQGTSHCQCKSYVAGGLSAVLWHTPRPDPQGVRGPVTLLLYVCNIKQKLHKVCTPRIFDLKAFEKWCEIYVKNMQK